MSDDDPALLKRALERERQARKHAETLLEDKSRELYLANQTLQENNQQLSELLEKLTKKQAQLIASRKLAATGQLAAGMAHEINNPLAFIRTNFNALHQYAKTLVDLSIQFNEQLEAHTDQELTKKLQALIAEGSDLAFIDEDLIDLEQESADGFNRIEQIVRSLLSFTETDKAEIERTDQLATVIEQLTQAMPAILEKHPHIQFNSEIEVITDYAVNGEKFLQALRAVMDNAIKAVAEEGRVSLLLKQTEQSVVIQVQDDGCGMSAEVMERATEPFYTTRPVGEAIGLGLFIAHRIVEEHGGQLCFESEENQGTTVTIELSKQGKQ